MSDLIERLRHKHSDRDPEAHDLAADEIERLHERRDLLASALDKAEADNYRLRRELAEARGLLRHTRTLMREADDLSGAALGEGFRPGGWTSHYDELGKTTADQPPVTAAKCSACDGTGRGRWSVRCPFCNGVGTTTVKSEDGA